MRTDIAIHLNVVPNFTLLNRLQNAWKSLKDGLKFPNQAEWEKTEIFSNMKEMEDYMFSFRE